MPSKFGVLSATNPSHAGIAVPLLTYTSAIAVTPSDGTDLANPSLALWIGGAGSVSIDLLESGTSIVLAAVPAGTLLPVRAKRVRSTGTTATSITSFD